MELTRSAPDLPDDTFAEGCPNRLVLDHLTSKWGILILTALADSPRRWGELRRLIGGVSEKMLAQTLRTLERDGLIDRTVIASSPVRVTYALTDLGADAATRLVPLVTWASEHASTVVGNRARFEKHSTP